MDFRSCYRLSCRSLVCFKAKEKNLRKSLHFHVSRYFDIVLLFRRFIFAFLTTVPVFQDPKTQLMVLHTFTLTFLFTHFHWSIFQSEKLNTLIEVRIRDDIMHNIILLCWIFVIRFWSFETHPIHSLLWHLLECCLLCLSHCLFTTLLLAQNFNYDIGKQQQNWVWFCVTRSIPNKMKIVNFLCVNFGLLLKNLVLLSETFKHCKLKKKTSINVRNCDVFFHANKVNLYDVRKRT